MYDPVYIIPMLLSTVVSASLSIYIWWNRAKTRDVYFAPMIFAVAVWSGSATLEILAPTFEAKLFWARFQFFGMAPLPVLWLFFALDFTGYGGRFADRRKFWLFLPAIVSILLVWTNAYHGLMWADIRLTAENPYQLVPQFGLWYWTGLAGFSWPLILVGFLCLLRRLLSAASVYRDQLAILLLAFAVGVVANIVQLTGFSPLPHVDLTPISFSVSCLLVAWGLFFYRLFDLVPVAFEAVFHDMQHSVVIVDEKNRIAEINPHALGNLGESRSEVLGRNLQEVYSHFPDSLELSAANDTETEVTARDKHGEPRRLAIRISPLRDWRGEVSGGIVAWRDITESDSQRKRIEDMAYRDFLTSLPNRRALYDIAGRALALAQRREWGVALLFLDLDRFKTVNDALGHASGDLLLQMVAARLRSAVRGEDTLSRLGGDEFALLIQDTTAESARRAAVRLLASLESPFEIKGSILQIQGSIGIAMYPQAGERVDDLLAQADVAMYQAKGSSNSLSFYDPTQDLLTQELLKLETEFRQALESDELVLEYQPVLDLATNEVAGFESFVRWRHPEHGSMEPADFVDVLEERSLTWALDRYVLQRAVSELASLDCAIGVNLSAKSLLNEELYALVETTLAKHNVFAGRLVLEISERSIATPQRPEKVFKRLQELGVGILADDFGSGFSSLTYLRKFPLSVLKLHRDIVRGVGRQPEDEAIIEALVTIARSLRIRVIAKGVESEEQLRWLKDHGCDFAQGAWISAPLPLEKVAGCLESAKQRSARE